MSSLLWKTRSFFFLLFVSFFSLLTVFFFSLCLLNNLKKCACIFPVKILNEQEERKRSENEKERTIDHLREELRATNDHFGSKIQHLEEKLNMLVQFEEEKEGLEEEVNTLKNQLNEERVHQNEFTERMELSVMREKEKLRKQLEDTIEEEKKRIEAESLAKLSLHSRMTIQENQNQC